MDWAKSEGGSGIIFKFSTIRSQYFLYRVTMRQHLVGAGTSLKQLAWRDVYVREFEDVKKSDWVNSAGRTLYVKALAYKYALK